MLSSCVPRHGSLNRLGTRRSNRTAGQPPAHTAVRSPPQAPGTDVQPVFHWLLHDMIDRCAMQHARTPIPMGRSDGHGLTHHKPLPCRLRGNMQRPTAIAVHLLALACIVALVLPAAGGARVVDWTTTTLAVHQDANSTVPSNATTLGLNHVVNHTARLVGAAGAHDAQCNRSLHRSAQSTEGCRCTLASHKQFLPILTTNTIIWRCRLQARVAGLRRLYGSEQAMCSTSTCA